MAALFCYKIYFQIDREIQILRQVYSNIQYNKEYLRCMKYKYYFAHDLFLYSSLQHEKQIYDTGICFTCGWSFEIYSYFAKKETTKKFPDSINRTTFFTLLFSFPLKFYLETNMKKIYLIDQFGFQSLDIARIYPRQNLR